MSGGAAYMRLEFTLALTMGLLSLPWSASALQWPEMPVEDRGILEDLYRSTDGDHWKDRDGWLGSGSPCEWRGVWCEPAYPPYRVVVTGISLPFNNLRGVLPESIGSLKHLRVLDVAGNELSGPVPERLLRLWDQHLLEFEGGGNCFANLLARVRLEYSASGTLCSYDDDVRFTLEVAEDGSAVFRSVRCMAGAERETHCLVRKGWGPSLARLDRGLRALDFERLDESYNFPFTGATHAVFLTTTAWWGDGSSRRLETYGDQGPIEAGMAQQLFTALLPECHWELEYFTPECEPDH